MLFDKILLVAGVLPIIACAYLGILTLLSRAPRATRPKAATHRFVVLVPAHNEEAGIKATLLSLRAMDYPRHLWRMIVIADNCTDRTALQSVLVGADVIQRNDTSHIGKGYALEFAIGKLLSEPVITWDALAVIDADSTVSANLLASFDAKMSLGEDAVQAVYAPQPVPGNRLSVITEVAFAAFHIIRSNARERLGLSTGLRGNGMAFSRKVLASTPHSAYSRTEDLEFGIQLGMAGVRVAFASEASVFGEMPVSDDVASRQRLRWIGGRFDVARAYLPTLIVQSLRRRSLLLADLAMDLIVPPLSLLALAVVGGFAMSTVSGLIEQRITPALITWAISALLLAAHVGAAASIADRKKAFASTLLFLPRYMADKTFIAIKSLVLPGGEWIRTTRKAEIT